MIRDFGTFVLVICGALLASADRAGHAQTIITIVPETPGAPTRCSDWTPVPTDPVGTKRTVIPTVINRTDVPMDVPGRLLSQNGNFVIQPNVWIGLLSEPNTYNLSYPRNQFTVRSGSSVSFYVIDAGGLRKPDPLQPRGGHITLPIEELRSRPLVTLECIKTTANEWTESGGGVDREGKIAADALKPFEPKPEAPPNLRDKFGDGAANPAPAPAGRPAAPPSPSRDPPRPSASIPAPEGGLLSKIFGGGKPPAPAPAEPRASGLAEVFGAGAGAGSPPKIPVERPSTEREDRPANPGAIVSQPLDPPRTAAEPSKPPESAPKIVDPEPKAPAVKAEPAAAGPVCNASLEPLDVLGGVKLASMQTVGIRNGKAEAAGFDYIEVGAAAAVPLPDKIDVADSVGKLTPYEAVARRGPDSTWVTIQGVDETRAKRAPAAASKPVQTLRLIIISGAAELAISGLDAVDAELTKQSGGLLKLDIEWHAVDETGSIRFAGPHESLKQLMKAAADKAAGRRPDVLNEAQLKTFFADFSKLMGSQTRPVDRVFWIKGAYPIPSSIPALFEDFIASVSSSNAVARAPSGRVGKWLVIVTARMPGFSVSYLKEPVYSLQIGDVLEAETLVSGPQRLIADPGLLATRLRISLRSLPAAPPPKDEPVDSGAVQGRLVIDASDVFDERGYVLSVENAQALLEHLRRVRRLWSDPLVRTETPTLEQSVLQAFADKTKKAWPSLMDILQNADDVAFPRLPRAIPDWLRKPVKDLNPTEREGARTFVARYAKGVEDLVGATLKLKKSAEPTDVSCGMYYASDDMLGLVKF